MPKFVKQRLLVFLIVGALGVGLHFLYEWLPCAITAIISPVNESVWEHVKLIFYPLLIAGTVLTKWQKGCRGPWLAGNLAACLLMLAAGYIYNILFWGEAMWVNIAIYIVCLAVGFILPGLFAGWAASPMAEGVLTAAAGLFWVVIVWCSFAPPDQVLFQDLSGAQSWRTIPC